MSFSVRDGIGSTVPGRLTPLPDEISPPTSTRASTRPAPDSTARSRTRPSSISSSCPGVTASASPANVTSSSPGPPRPAAASTTVSPGLTE